MRSRMPEGVEMSDRTGARYLQQHSHQHRPDESKGSPHPRLGLEPAADPIASQEPCRRTFPTRHCQHGVDDVMAAIPSHSSSMESSSPSLSPTLSTSSSSPSSSSPSSTSPSYSLSLWDLLLSSLLLSISSDLKPRIIVPPSPPPPRRTACNTVTQRPPRLPVLLLVSCILVTGTSAITTTVTATTTEDRLSEAGNCRVSRYQPSYQSPPDGVCSTINIQDKVDNLKYLDNCTVIEGNLHIAIIEYASQEDYDKYSFPNLREVTGHVLLYRVFGLRTLRRLFPGLTVIRGQELFYEYSLAVVEMRDLEELGLVSLSAILNGAVRIVRNSKLCYVNTVDWGRLASGVDPEEHYVMENRDDRMCPDVCNETCAKSRRDGEDRAYCWGYRPEDCQKNLQSCQCGTNKLCAPDGSCCHNYCVGGCRGPGESQCHACRDVLFEGECLPKCPLGTYMYANRRCLLDKQCLELRQTSPQGHPGGKVQKPKLLERNGGEPSLCVMECPDGYMVDNTTVLQCVKCQGFCPKVCNSTSIHHMEDSEKLFGCSKIEGHLEIQIWGGRNVDTVLSRNLGAIREVTDYIKVMSSHALTTLYFFKGLEVIGGRKLAHKHYSLLVLDNNNLQEIFPKAQIAKMSIQRGRVSCHYNRKLCYYRISNLTQALNITPFINSFGVNVDISNQTNGDFIPCDEQVLHIQAASVGSTSINLFWTKYKTTDMRQLNNYNIFYKATNEEVEDIFKGRDLCSVADWVQKPHKASTEGDFEVELLTELDPFTRYAIYVQASTLSTATDAGLSPVIYVTTKASMPTEPRDLKVTSADPHELLVQWEPPKNANGVVTHYKVFYTLQDINMDTYGQRDYCQHPTVEAKLQELEKARMDGERRRQEHQLKLDNCCACPLTPEQQQAADRISRMDIYFEDNLHTRVFTKRWGKECLPRLPAKVKGHTNSSVELDDRKGNSSSSSLPAPSSSSSSSSSSTAAPFLLEGSGEWEGVDGNGTNITAEVGDGADLMTLTPTTTHPTHEVIVYDTKVVLKDLEHFREYNIEIVACHDTDPKTGKKMCGDNSTSTSTLAQTQPDAPLDNINASLIEVQPFPSRPTEAYVTWSAPVNPNGPILKYTLKYKRLSDTVYTEMCVSRREYFNNSGGFILSDLGPGNYSLQISATSLADTGQYSPEVYFYMAHRQDTEENDTDTLYVAVAAVSSVIVLLGLGFFFFLKHKISRDPTQLLVSPNLNYLNTETYDIDEWEVDRDKIRLLHEVGKGSFGLVYEGVMEDPVSKAFTTVAVKTVNDTADFHERLRILKEATTMKVFECHHVVKLLGVVSQGQPALVIMEYMALGDLRGYLRKCRLEEEDYPEFHPPVANQIRQMAGEIADGMAYLANKRIVHRDLAARNCLVSEDITVKIADFGMARDVYFSEYYRKDQKALLPIRWMAPESLRDGVFTTMSDVWSYGVVLWEMVSLAEQPYQGLSNEEVIRFVTTGHKMPMPTGCPMDLYDMMRRCWHFCPKERPTFKFLIEKVLSYLGPTFKEVSFFSQQLMAGDSSSDLDDIDDDDDDDDDDGKEPGGAMAGYDTHVDMGHMDGDVDDYHGDDNDDDDDDGGGGRGGGSLNDDADMGGGGGGKWMCGLSDGGSSGFPTNSSGDEDPTPTPTSSLTPPTHQGGFPPFPPPPSSHHKHPHPQPWHRMSPVEGASPSLPSRGNNSPLLLEQGRVKHPLLFPPPSSINQPPRTLGSCPSSLDGDNDETDEDNHCSKMMTNDLFIPDSDDEGEASGPDWFHPSHPTTHEDPGMSEHSKLLPSQPSSGKNRQARKNVKVKVGHQEGGEGDPYLIMLHPTGSPRIPSTGDRTSPSGNEPPTPADASSHPATPPYPKPSNTNPLPSSPPGPSSLNRHPPPSDKLRNSTKPSSSHGHSATPSTTPSQGHHPRPSVTDGSGGDITITSGSGSKESSSSGSSRFSPATANGHGPYSHQQAAFC